MVANNWYSDYLNNPGYVWITENHTAPWIVPPGKEPTMCDFNKKNWITVRKQDHTVYETYADAEGAAKKRATKSGSYVDGGDCYVYELVAKVSAPVPQADVTPIAT